MRKAESRLRNRFFIPAYWLLALFLACVVTLSLSFWQTGTAEAFTASRGAPSAKSHGGRSCMPCWERCWNGC